MPKIKHSLFLIMGFFVVIVYMEAILRWAAIGRIIFSGTIYWLAFCLSLALVLFLLCSLAQKHRKKTIAFILYGIAFMFASQLIYFKVFKTFYSVYSAGNAGQVLEFWKETAMVVLRNLHWLVLLFLPAILFSVLKRRFELQDRVSWLVRAGAVGLIAAAHLLTITGIHYGSRSVHSAYDLYYQSSFPVASVRRFGLATTMRLDLQRTLLGWSPKIELPVDAFPGVDEPPVPSKYNVLPLDFDKLLAQEEDETYRELHQFFSLIPATEKNEMTGKYKGYNLVFITAESLASFAVRPDVTPTLYKLVNEGYKFTEFYNPYWGVSTSDGEYVACVGLLPKSGVWSMYMSGSNYLPFTMGNQLRNLGYHTVAFHNHDHDFYRRHVSHPNLGYEFQALGLGLELSPGWPASDLEMMEQTVPRFIRRQPFHSYFMTVSGHHQYNFQRNAMAIKNRHLVEDLPLSTTAQAYLATQIELDRALEHLLAELERTGAIDNTLIVLSPDHYPYALDHSVMEELAGKEIEKHFGIYNSTLIIYAKGMEPTTIDKPCSSLDIIPTISNLLGLEYDSRLLMGRDIFSEADPLVMFVDSSFISAQGRYNALEGEFFPNPGVELEDEAAYIERMIAIIRAKFYISARILETDYYRYILGR